MTAWSPPQDGTVPHQGPAPKSEVFPVGKKEPEMDVQLPQCCGLQITKPGWVSSHRDHKGTYSRA